ncbi:MAG: biopolymer transporter ExbD [Myxococcales bacterium]|nr:biopolymer transporter ExbD [Myxococcales bacterium]HRC58373.1 biopolymer transporter ExbD [Kofleriaceae bacterium]
MSASVHVRGHRLSGGRKPKLDQVRNDINVTPLVDVVLVLLIIFMVVTPLMARGREIPNLPKTRHHSQEKDHLQPVVAIDKEGNLWYDQVKLGPVDDKSLAEMGEKIQRSWDAPKDPDGAGKVYVKASGELTYKQVYPLLVYLNKEKLVGSIDLATGEVKE